MQRTVLASVKGQREEADTQAQCPPTPHHSMEKKILFFVVASIYLSSITDIGPNPEEFSHA